MTAAPNASSSGSDMEMAGMVMVMDAPVLVDDATYQLQYRTLGTFEAVEINHERYGLVLLASGAAIPVAASLLRLLPLPVKLTNWVYGALINPPLFGSYHAVPVLGVAIVPTRGQAIFILYLIVVNAVLSFVGIWSASSSSWYSSDAEEIAIYISNRVGVLSFANLVLVFLFSSRNNFLLWLTNWSSSTFLLAHRWVALICAVQAMLHSAIYLYDRKVFTGTYDVQSQEPFWIWGIVATVAATAILFASVVPLRRRLYEVFLVTHIVLAVLMVVGCYQHIVVHFQNVYGYELWIYLVIAVWVFDRAIRLARALKNGVRRAYVTKVDDDYFRVDIPSLDCSGQVYIYFLTLSVRVWENHPFSVFSTSARFTAEQAAGGSEKEVDSKPTVRAKPSGATFFIKKQGGMTALVAAAAGSPSGLLVLVESSYGSSGKLLQEDVPEVSVQYPNIVCIAGGVGITAIMPVLERGQTAIKTTGEPTSTTRKLFWGVRSGDLVDAVQSAVASETDGECIRWGSFDVEISIGKRLGIQKILEAELRSDQGTIVVVCGPGSMSDEVRVVSSRLARAGALVKLVEHAWVL
ncbi:hypothetical protein HK405_014145 [Cladochytrium tenue]|nr:hypothetical protein HK405_014145 [Cladochytrium tenue]